MIDFIKRHKVTFLTLLVGIGIFGYGLFYRIQKDNYEEKLYEQIVEKDPEYPLTHPKKEKIDTLSTYFTEIYNMETIDFIGYVGSLLAIIPCCFLFYRHYKTGFIQNELTRESYKKWFSKMLLKMYSTSLVLPITVVLGIFLFYLYCGNFDIQYTIDNFTCPIRFFENVSNPNAKQLYFTFWYIMNFVCFGIFLANLSMITCKKSKNVFMNMVLTYVLYCGVDIMNEFCYRIFARRNDTLIYIGNIFMPEGLNNLWGDFEGIGDPKIIFPFMVLLAVLSTIVVLVFYRKKESVLLECE